MGIRDRIILEVLYSTDMRRMEVIGLRWDDIQALHRGDVIHSDGYYRYVEQELLDTAVDQRPAVVRRIGMSWNVARSTGTTNGFLRPWVR